MKPREPIGLLLAVSPEARILCWPWPGDEVDSGRLACLCVLELKALGWCTVLVGAVSGFPLVTVLYEYVGKDL